jgi:hypothetical protein
MDNIKINKLINPGEVARGMIRPHLILLYYSTYILYVAVCTLHILLPTSLVVSYRLMTINSSSVRRSYS